MEEKKENELMKNIEKMQAFSNLMGNGEAGGTMNPQDMVRAMEMAGKINQFMNMMQEEEQEEMTVEEESAEHIFSQGKEIRMLNAAIPFLDKEYQKNLFIAVKLMELKRVRGMDMIHIQSNENMPPNPKKDRRKALLRAIRPYLSQEEQKNIDMMMKMMKMKTIMGMMNKEEL